MWYKNIRQHMLKKIILFYTIIAIISIGLLAGVSLTLLQTNKQNEFINNNITLIDNTERIMNKKTDLAQHLANQLYENNLYQTAIISFMETGIPDFYSLSLDYYMEKDISLMSALESYCRFALNSDSSLSCITIYSTNHFIYTYYNYSRAVFIGTDREKFSTFETAFSDYNARHFPIYTKGIPIDNETYDFTIIQEISNPKTLKPIGNLILQFDSEKALDKYLSSYSNETYGDIQIRNSYNELLYTSDDDKINEVSTTSHHINQSITHNITITGTIPTSTIVHANLPTIYTILAVCILVIVFVILSSIGFSREYSKRLTNITGAIKKIHSGDLSARITLSDKNDELTEISKNFNTMCDDIEYSIEKIYIHEVKQKNAELRFLQAQINPHFLYNTLEAIRMRAAVYGAIDVSEMIYILATFFRNSLDRDTITTIEKEVEHCNLYLKLFQIRYQDRLKVSFNINPKLNSYSMVKLSLQPLVENAIVHGFDLDSNENCITISADFINDDIEIVLKDNGKGITPTNLQSINDRLNHSDESTSIGLSNVHDRLKLVYGARYGVSIESTLGVGTTIRLLFPAKKKGDL